MAMTQELKDKMAAGRARAAEARRNRQLEPAVDILNQAGLLASAEEPAILEIEEPPADRQTPDLPSQIAEDQAHRPKRVSLADKRNILTTENVPSGYIARWVNDEGKRIHDRQEAGYMFVLDTPRGRVVVGDRQVDPTRQTGSIVSKVVGTDATGKPLISYLMVQRDDWYQADQKTKQSEIDKVMEQIRSQEQSSGLVRM